MDPLPLLSPYSYPLIRSSASMLRHFFFCLKTDDGLKELGHQFCWSGVKINLYSYLTIKRKPTEWCPIVRSPQRWHGYPGLPGGRPHPPEGAVLV